MYFILFFLQINVALKIIHKMLISTRTPLSHFHSCKLCCFVLHIIKPSDKYIYLFTPPLDSCHWLGPNWGNTRDLFLPQTVALDTHPTALYEGQDIQMDYERLTSCLNPRALKDKQSTHDKYHTASFHGFIFIFS